MPFFLPYIDFEITDIPPWRTGLQMGCSRMVREIVEFQRQWEDDEKSKRKTILRKVEERMSYEFVQHINTCEDTGTQLLYDTISVLTSNRRTPSPTKRQQETRNIRNALLQLNEIASSSNVEEDRGLLELDTCVLDIHRTLLADVDVRAGTFSTCVRETEYKGEKYIYPLLLNERDARERVQALLDSHNTMRLLINKRKKKKKDTTAATMTNIFKCTAWLFFELVSLHPFADGNGRLCQLLCNYALRSTTPFPSAIYNSYADCNRLDFLDTLVTARSSVSRKPCDLASMIVESNWYGWRRFLDLTKNM